MVYILVGMCGVRMAYLPGTAGVVAALVGTVEPGFVGVLTVLPGAAVLAVLALPGLAVGLGLGVLVLFSTSKTANNGINFKFSPKFHISIHPCMHTCIHLFCIPYLLIILPLYKSILELEANIIIQYRV